MPFTVSPLAKIITLASTLALGFILIILSCALYNNWVPLTVGKCRANAHPLR
jgi:hypothetical protein